MKRIFTFIALLLLLCSNAGAVEEQEEIKIGSRKTEVLKAFGRPDVEMLTDEGEVLQYGHGELVVRFGRVVRMDHDIAYHATRRNKAKTTTPARALPAPPRARQPTARRTPPPRTGARQIQLGGTAKATTESKTAPRKKGARVGLKDLLVPGKVTVVDFYADWCGPCKRIAPHLAQLAKAHADVELRKVDIVNWKTPVVKQYGIRSVPNIRVYDKSGRLVGTPTSNLGAVRKYVEQAKR